MVNKPAKPFMVSQTTILLERDLLDIQEEDSTVWKQLENYNVLRVTSDNRPVYTSTDDHAVDALMLAVLGMTLNFPELADVIREAKPATKIGVLKRNHYLEKALDSVKTRSSNQDNSSGFFDVMKIKSKSTARNGIGWAPRGSRDFKPKSRRSW